MQPTFAAIAERAHVVSLPLTTRFRGVEHREAMLIEGDAGWGEWSPFLEYEAREAATWLRAAIADASEARPAALRDRVEVNATLPAVGHERVAEVLARYDGCGTVKVKVAERGQSLSDDILRVRTVRELAPDVRIRIDANGGWSVPEAIAAISAISEFGLEYVEQPVASIAELRSVRDAVGGLGVPIAADESVRKASDPLAVARAGAADLIVVKVQPLGGIRTALSIVESAGLPAVVSSAIDTSVGLSAGVALAAALPSLPYACGLGTASLLAADVVKPSLLANRGSLPVGRVEPDPALLDAFEAPPERRAWWFDRLRAALPYLGADAEGAHAR